MDLTGIYALVIAAVVSAVVQLIMLARKRRASRWSWQPFVVPQVANLAFLIRWREVGEEPLWLFGVLTAVIVFWTLCGSLVGAGVINALTRPGHQDENERP